MFVCSLRVKVRTLSTSSLIFTCRGNTRVGGLANANGGTGGQKKVEVLGRAANETRRNHNRRPKHQPNDDDQFAIVSIA